MGLGICTLCNYAGCCRVSHSLTGCKLMSFSRISFRTLWFFLTVVRAIVFLLGVPRGVERNAQQIAIPRVFIV